MKNIQMLELKRWEIWGGMFYNVHLPREFTFKCVDPKLFKENFNWVLLLERHGPCADGNGSHHFFGTNAEARTILESPKGYVIQVREDRDSYGNWRDAVYEVRSTDKPNVWTARLLLVNMDHPKDLSEHCTHHLTFELKSLVDDRLQVIQNIQNAEGERKKVEEYIVVFDDKFANPPRNWLVVKSNV